MDKDFRREWEQTRTLAEMMGIALDMVMPQVAEEKKSAVFFSAITAVMAERLDLKTEEDVKSALKTLESALRIQASANNEHGYEIDGGYHPDVKKKN